jgi:hypothetical protein
MQPVCEDEAITIAPNQDGCLLSDFQYTLRDLLDGLWLERLLTKPYPTLFVAAMFVVRTRAL